MLVLSRKPGEEIVIVDQATGERITISAVDCTHRRVRLGIEASRRFRILRAEIEAGNDTEHTRGA